MTAWKVVAVVNLALLLGVGWGYAWWGRRSDRLAAELAETRARAGQLERELAAARPAGAAGSTQQWVVHGVVRAVLPDMNVVVLTHEDIPGVMSAMTMGFRLAAPEIAQTVRVGDAVRFTLRGTPPNDVVLTAIQAAK
jgi:Cu/Ag efflux protein CusF